MGGRQSRSPSTGTRSRLAEHQRSRWVAEPLHLLDCSLVTNGAIAVIVTSAQRAARGPSPPVHVWGWGQGQPGQPRAGRDFGLVTGRRSGGPGRDAHGGHRSGRRDVCELYDCYTYTVLVTLEDYGFCAKGEGGPFAASGALGPGGTLPVNTGGGQLSSYYMWGITPLSEAVIQARGDGGDRQAPATDVILVSGNGGILAHHATLVLSPHPARTSPGALAHARAAEPGRDGATGGPAAGRPQPAGPDGSDTWAPGQPGRTIAARRQPWRDPMTSAWSALTRAAPRSSRQRTAAS